MKVKIKGIRKIGISGEFIRLDALLKFSAIAATGGEAKILISRCEIYVNSKTCIMRGKKIRPGDIVRHGNTILIVDQAK